MKLTSRKNNDNYTNNKNNKRKKFGTLYEKPLSLNLYNSYNGEGKGNSGNRACLN